jgi:superfamily II DNA/RNA helicase
VTAPDHATVVSPGRATLGARIPSWSPTPAHPESGHRAPGRPDPGTILEHFLGWVSDRGIEPYQAQEEAFLELLGGAHVILGTPTGSGKTLVAALLHFKAMCEWQRACYTCPTKALASEKFFWLCDEFGPERVGMLTGDASINPDAPIIVCTTEILANMALRRGSATPMPYVVMDEFHYYGDPSRGAAWQIPLLVLSQTQFLLMSATMGDTTDLAQRLHSRTSRRVSEISSDERPVPLDWSYVETPLHKTVEDLLHDGRAPIYIVHFTQREAAERAQSLTSAKIAPRELRDRIRAEIGDFRFDTAYGRELRRFLGFGIGVHHAGLLPKYRLLVEQLAQRGLLRVICGTDTLGVGVNIPIRTVLFSKLVKYDGQKVGVLSPREFRQIAGRAGRRGFDDLGSVVCQAPEHVIDRLRGGKGKGGKGGKAPRGGPGARPAGGLSGGPGPRGRPQVSWDRNVFHRLIHQAQAPLRSAFRMTFGIMVHVLQRDPAMNDVAGYPAVIDLIDRSHESPPSKRGLRRDAAKIFRALRRAGIVRIERDPRGRRVVTVDDDLQESFSLDRALSLYLVDALAALDPQDESYAVDVLSFVEAILENPLAILIAQERRAKSELIAALKAEGVPYEERIERVDEVTYPKPNAELIYQTFEIFAERHPWIGREEIRPKSIAREMFETYSSFEDYVRQYELARIEGTLLRYLGDVYRTLVHNVPAYEKLGGVPDAVAFLRALIERVDRSLLQEWESLRFPGAVQTPIAGEPAPARIDLARDARALAARVRAEMHSFVRALSRRDYEDAALWIRFDAEDPWGAARITSAMAPFFADYETLVFTPRARLAEWTRVEPTGHRTYDVVQVLLDPDDENFWCVEGDIDLVESGDPSGPLVRVTRIGR